MGIEISIKAFRDAWAASLASSFADWHVMDPIEWAETTRRRVGQYSSTEGFSFDYFPPQRGMYEAIFDRINTEIVLKMFSRGTKTETVLTALGYFIHQRPRRIIVMWPKVDDAEKWSKDELQEQLIAPTPELSEIVADGTGTRKSNQTILFKTFPGGNLMACGANSPGTLRRAKGSFLYGEEIDSIEDFGKEGDPLAQLKKRGSEYADTIEVYASYPSLKGRSRIEAKYEESDQRKWHVPCLACGFDRWVFERERDLRFDKENPAGAVIECPNCGGFHQDPARYQMMRSGLWVATKEFKGRAGFHASSLLWPHPTDPIRYPGGYLQMLAQQVIDCETSANPEAARMVMANTCDAVAYQPKVDNKAESTELYKRREEYDSRLELPEGVLQINAGVDIQNDRIEVDLCGYGLDEQSWGIEYVVIAGDPLTPQPWEKLEKLLERYAYKHPLYGFMGITAMAVDAGFRPDEVLKFTRRRLRRRVWAVVGSPTLGKVFVTKPRKQGNPPAVVFELGTNEAKDIIYQRLELPAPEPGQPAPYGFMHFPKIACYDEAYFKGLTVEDSTMERARDGKFYRQFVCPKGARNEPLDTRVYCNALPRIMRTNFVRLKNKLDATPKAEQRQEPENIPVATGRPKIVRRRQAPGEWLRRL